MNDRGEDLGEDLLADESVTMPVTDSAVVFDGAISSVVRESFRYGDEIVTREFVEHPGAVAVLALDEAQRVLLIKQYRHAIGAREWELPAGLLDEPGEDPLAAAKRELAEETDLAAAEWSLLSEFYTSPGGSSELLRVYLARGLSPVVHDFERTAEEADLELRWVDLAEVVAAALDTRLRNGILVTAVLALSATL